MAKIYKRNCDYCGKYYEGVGKKFCSIICRNKFFSTKEHRKKIGEFFKGKTYEEIGREPMSEETKRKIGLSNSIVQKGQHNSPSTEFKKGIIPHNKTNIYVNCKNCGKKFKVKQSQLNIGRGKYCSRKCMYEYLRKNELYNTGPLSEEHKRKIGEAQLGEKNHNWNNGSSFEPYPQKFNNKLREKIRQRDNYTCQLCGKKQKEELQEYKRRLAIHHMDYIKENCKENNLITLCGVCNSIVNFNRDDWTKYFQNKLNRKEK